MNSLASALVSKGLAPAPMASKEPEKIEQPKAPRTLVSRELVRDGGETLLVFTDSGSARWNPEAKHLNKGYLVQTGTAEWVNFVFKGSNPSHVGTRMTGTWKIERLTFQDGAVFHEVVVTLKRRHNEPLVKITAGKVSQAEDDIQLAGGGYISVKHC
jgi:hypothetical protein